MGLKENIDNPQASIANIYPTFEKQIKYYKI